MFVIYGEDDEYGFDVYLKWIVVCVVGLLLFLLFVCCGYLLYCEWIDDVLVVVVMCLCDVFV